MHDKMPLIASRDVNLGDLVWVLLPCSSWWLAQAVDENSVSGKLKPINKSAGEVLVRLYGSYKYLYVDPIMSHGKFEDKHEAYSGNYMDILKETLEQELKCLRSGRSRRKEVKSKEFASDEVSQESILKQDVTNKSQDAITLNSKTENKFRSKVQNHKVVQKRPRPSDLNPVNLCAPSSKRSSAQKGVPKNSNPSKLEIANNSVERSNELLRERRIKVMQTLGLIAPSGSPFHLKSWTHFSRMEYL
ncbi:Hypothetical predicted protein [Olea europaea subsp. europaea]|uniref:PWWP domain-containing protein n=2 Tax=Olea europaea subsp. europaea TaxID=158383 RepID=A0A8S0TJ02_OLEEU|nr:Hypothetical predicted protein [Olea europaea subsp. europaea]